MTKKPIIKKRTASKGNELTEADKGLVDKTIEEQKRILDLLNVPYKILNNKITI